MKLEDGMYRPKSLIILLLLTSVMNWWGLIATSGTANAGNLEVLYFFAGSERQEVPEHVQLAADAFGIDIGFGSCEEFPDEEIFERVAGVMVSPEVAVADAVCISELLANLTKSIPVLFPGLRPLHQKALGVLGLPVKIEADLATSLNPQEVIVHPVSLASFFGGLRINLRPSDAYRLTLPDSQTIMGFTDSNEGAHYLVKSAEMGREFFLLADTQLIPELPLLESDNLLLQALPYLMFFARVGGDRVWQGSALFANLTIDDPFLVEPYGSLSFDNLLQQMDSHRFHTTIGFIPQNFNRNEKNTVALFKGRPDRFSIAVHGNNHDRKEFYRYASKNLLEPFGIKTLEEQEFNLRQALTRMNEFSRITGIPYDPVMIFPQGIAPAATLGLCKKVGYLATVNGSDVPLDSEMPHRIRMSFRPYNTHFYGFLSLRRVRVDYCSELRIRADLFLGNPLLIYTHHDSFESGMEHFNSFADLINTLCPSIQWRSVNNIISQWFPWRHTGNNIFEVKMLSPVCIITNDDTDVKRYDISKEEDATRIVSVTIDGEPIPWKKESDRIHFGLEIPPGVSKQVRINYGIDVYPEPIGLNEGTSYVALFYRRLAEFRDRVLSRFLVGRLARDFLYESGISTWIPLICITLITIAVGGMLIRRFSRGSLKEKSF